MKKIKINKNLIFRYLFEIVVIIFSITASFYIQDLLNKKDKKDDKNKGLEGLLIELEKDKRPLISHLKNIDEINDFVGKHLFERKEFYTKADFMIYTKKKSVKNIALELEKLLT